MIYFVGAGPGAVDLITVRGQRLLEQADVIVYAGSLVNAQLLEAVKADCQIYNSAKMTLEEVVALMVDGQQQGKMTVRLHTGDPSLYGAIQEQMDQLEQRGLPYEVVPGVSSLCGAAAALRQEYTLPGVSQSVIITRMAGRTPVPVLEEISLLAAHQATMVIFLSSGMLSELTQRLMIGGYEPDTPAAVVYKASWPEEKILRGTVATIAQLAHEQQITQTALVLVGRFLEQEYERSQLYHPAFSHGFREATQ